jgi:hypothetical protein
MRRLTPLATAIGAVAVGMTWLALAGPAAAADVTAPLYDHMRQQFTTTEPKASTGWSFDGALQPWFASLNPRPGQQGTTFVFPPGTRFDLTGVPNCAASDEDLRLNGLGACPEGSLVGSGEASLLVGSFTLPVKLHEFAAGSGFAVVLTYGGSVLGVLRSTIDDTRVTSTSSPPSGTWVTSFRLTNPQGGTDKHPVLRTPPHCPKSGQWTFTYLPVYEEPYGVQRSTSSVPCDERD